MFFEANPALLTRVLEKFVQFVHHNHVKVRMRSWYLLQRFVKYVRHHVGNVAETLIHRTRTNRQRMLDSIANFTSTKLLAASARHALYQWKIRFCIFDQ